MLSLLCTVMGTSDKPASALNAARRTTDLERLADGWCPDVLVIGAGFTGCGVALDAVSRGLTAAVVDRGDLANGTSRWSSKLVHGGLRYLAKGSFGLAHESARERGILMAHVAPHLIRPLSFLTPINDGMPMLTGVLAGVGYLAGDLLRLTAGTTSATLRRPGWVSAAQTRRLAPAIGVRGLRGALRNTDGQLVDDARMVIALARTAAARGAAVMTYVRAEVVGRDHAKLRDLRGGGTFTARAGRVVVAAGVWSDTLDDRVRIRPSKGAHLIIDGAALGHPSVAVTSPIPGHRSRFAFLLPQLDGRVYLGLTDDPANPPIPDAAPVLDSEREFLLDAVNPVLERPLSGSDVLGGYVGYRPLVDPDSVPATVAGRPVASTADLSRRHLVIDDPERPITIVGGKLTTYRRMAADVIDRLTDRPCVTQRQPLVGALPRRSLAALSDDPWLVARYGGEAPAISQMIRAEPTLGRPIVDGLPYVRAELPFAVQREGALTAEDLVDRRTRIGLVPGDRTAALPIAEEFVTGPASNSLDLDRHCP